ncbi:hypothetical protein M752DRAFT_153697 [Aspergillus phoenicis ATCC 13157]|uniref:Uncharacterized protein n=1 Tax=Aspergillus phoenicis ATCC 13157 TaxID=1353007 RepID=A0A370PLX1_ASPPH|nr:hypothetical protein M752DRAFT_153697 [Aspergillus phoenicis ATCC 13157]
MIRPSIVPAKYVTFVAVSHPSVHSIYYTPSHSHYLYSHPNSILPPPTPSITNPYLPQ